MSPVIGIILMVAVTVILAALIGTFVLGTPGSQEVVPAASFSANQDATGVVFTHKGGADFDASNTFKLEVGVDGTFTDWGGAWTSSSVVQSGDFWNVSATSGQNVQLRWTATDGGSAYILKEYTVP